MTDHNITTLTLHERNLIARLNDANRTLEASDRNGLVLLIQRLTAVHATVGTFRFTSRIADLLHLLSPFPSGVYVSEIDRKLIQEAVRDIRAMLDAAPAAPVAEISARTEATPSKGSPASSTCISASGFDNRAAAEIGARTTTEDGK